MAAVAIFSPSLRGHRQTYCRVIAQILLGDGYDVFVVAGVPDGVRAVDLHLYPQLSDMKESGAFHFVPLPESGLPSLLGSPVGFEALLDGLDVGAVFLAEADACLSLLTSRIWRRGRRRRWVAVFIRTTNYRFGEEPQHLSRVERDILAVGRVRRTVANWKRDPQLFHEVLLPRLRLVDNALYLDETFVADHDAAFWLPDIYSSQAWRTDGAESETSEWAARAEEFMARQRGRPVFVYIGTSQARRGYDSLLRLAVAEEGCFVHCGRCAEDDGYRFDVSALRRELRQREALLETEGYYRSDSTVDLFLSRAEMVVLPHRGHLGSSGVMLQALAAGRPVLVPDQGLMAQRVRTHGLGRTYRHEDWDDLQRGFRLLEQEGRGGYVDAIEAFMSFFSPAQTENAVRHAMGYGLGPASAPTAWSKHESGTP
jgi:glycosyltransferase involved in cell wall biosynthesis